jgi:16S rRNA (guanine966-N2)-methyltransferase
MRIIGGTAAGTILKVPKGFDVRPTPDLVKQAIFNSLGERVSGVRVLELFAGTGALALESLSRGAESAVVVERSARHARLIEVNLESTRIEPSRFRCRVQDVFQALSQLAGAGERFDLIFADPPYGEKNIGKRSTSFAQKVLDDEHLPRVLASDGLLILGHTKRDTLELPQRWVEKKLMRHGDTVMRFLTAGA